MKQWILMIKERVRNEHRQRERDTQRLFGGMPLQGCAAGTEPVSHTGMPPKYVRRARATDVSYNTVWGHASTT